MILKLDTEYKNENEILNKNVNNLKDIIEVILSLILNTKGGNP